MSRSDLAAHKPSLDEQISALARSSRSTQPSEIAEPAAHYDAAAPASMIGQSSMQFEVARRVLARLEELETRYLAQGRSLRDLGSAEELAERMVATVPAPSPWDELGPFYSTTRVAKLLGGISRQAVADRRGRGTLLALRTADDAWVYPAFQFDDHNAVLRGLPEIVKILKASGVDDWTLASWLTSPMRSLDHRSAIDWLRRGRNRETLLSVTRDAARRFAQ